jgi:hypothetical protein
VARAIIIAGLLLVAVGVLMLFGDRLPIKFGRLPGDIVWKGRNTTVYVPIVTSILLSVVLSLLFAIFGRR